MISLFHSPPRIFLHLTLIKWAFPWRVHSAISDLNSHQPRTYPRILVLTVQKMTTLDRHILTKRISISLHCKLWFHRWLWTSSKEVLSLSLYLCSFPFLIFPYPQPFPSTFPFDFLSCKDLGVRKNVIIFNFKTNSFKLYSFFQPQAQFVTLLLRQLRHLNFSFLLLMLFKFSSSQ